MNPQSFCDAHQHRAVHAVYPKKLPRSTLGSTTVRRKENFIHKGRRRSEELFVLIREFYVSSKDEQCGLSSVSNIYCRSSCKYWNSHKSYSLSETWLLCLQCHDQGGGASALSSALLILPGCTCTSLHP